ncbi:MAG: phytanoyl-CoA dioxygenase family protein [Pseudomonadota bacterium]
MSETDTDRVIREVAEQGYARMAGVFEPSEVAAMLTRVHQLAANNTQAIRDLPRLDQGQETVYNLQNKDVDILKTLLHNPAITRVLCHFLNDQWHKAIDLSEPNYILRSFSARNNRVPAPLHIDSFIPYRGEHPLSMQVAVILEDQSEENGCTVVIPGSHQSGEYVSQDQRENAVPVASKAGDVVFWDSRIWHGTLENRTDQSRWSLIATFVRWWIKQGYQITRALPESVYRELSDRDKAVMGFCSMPLRDETRGIDFKKGYDDLLPRVSDYEQ